MFARSRALRPLSPFALIAIALASCSDGTAPGGGPQSGDLALGGDFDADGGTFVLGVTDSVPGNPLVVELIGGGLALDPGDEEISLQVAIRNVGADIHPPVMIWLGDFVPGSVSVVNPDAVAVAGGLADLLPPAYGFDYSELLGEDGVLASGETSRSKPWVFHDPGLASFAFDARLDAGLAPGLARLGGRVWVDRNGNGQPDDDEPGWHGAPILVETPGGETLLAYSNDAGRYGVPAPVAGLYQVTCDFSIFDMPPPLFTTPNPLSVLIAPDAGGEPQSFLHADFGLHWGAGPGEPVVFTEASPESLHLAPWTLIEARIEEDGLGLQVGFSGCQPEHPWTLYICGGFMESNPVQVRAVLVHELEEDCDAAFTRVLPFSLHPLRMAYEMAYGSGTLLIQLVDFQGQVHTIEYAIRGKDQGK
jgi:hypothetical protein